MEFEEALAQVTASPLRCNSSRRAKHKPRRSLKAVAGTTRGTTLRNDNGAILIEITPCRLAMVAGARNPVVQGPETVAAYPLLSPFLHCRCFDGFNLIVRRAEQPPKDLFRR